MAGKIALDLKQFKHVKSDKVSTTLRHKDGHELTMAHKSLSPEAQAQLDALAKISTDAKTSTQDAEEVAEKKAPVKMAEGGNVPSVADSLKVPANLPKLEDMSEDQKAMLLKSIMSSVVTDPTMAEKINYMLGAGQTKQEMVENAANNVAGTMGSIKMVGPATVEANTAVEGMNALKELQTAKPMAGETIRVVPNPGGPELVPQPTGNVNVIPDAVQPIGKVTGKVFANGGAVKQEDKPHYDVGGGVSTYDTNQLYTTDPNAAMPAIQQAYQTGMDNRIKFDTARFQDETPGFSVSPEEAKLKALTHIDREQEASKLNNDISQVKQQNLATQTAALQAKLGLPPDMNAAAQQGQQQADSTMSSQPVTSALAPQSLAGKVESQTGGMGGDPAGVFQQGYQNKLAGIHDEAAAVGNLGQSQAGILGQQIQAQQTAQQAYKDQYAGLEAERQAHMADIKAGHIDPEKYWDNHSKIASGIGMILAGFNPTNSPNAAVNFLKFQMEQNLTAQSKNLDSDQNLLAANLRQFGNLKDAADMTRIMQHDIVSNQLNQAAATAKTPMAQAAAKQAAGQLQMESANQFQAFAMRRAMMGLANNGGGAQSEAAVNQMLAYARLSNPEFAKEMTSRIVPGVGVSQSIPVSEATRSQMVMRNNFDSMAKRYLQFTQQHGGSFDPATVNQGKALAAELQGAFRQASNGGVFKEGEQKFIEKLIPDDPTQMFAQFRTNPKIKEILATNQAALNGLIKSNGIIPFAGQQQAPVVDQQAQAMAWAKANSKDPRSAQILQKLGK